MAAKRKTRTPRVNTRPVAVNTTRAEPPKPKRKPRRCIPANMPTICPECGHNTRKCSGSYKDPVHKQIVEYRDCVKCAERLVTPRQMTAREAEMYCTHAEGVAEYQESIT